MTHLTSETERELVLEYLTRLTSCDCDDCKNGIRWLCHPSRSQLLFRLQNRIREVRQNALKRFSDNPFRDPNLTPEQVARIEKRNEALRIYRETGDTSLAEEIGLFPRRKDTFSEEEGRICGTSLLEDS